MSGFLQRLIDRSLAVTPPVHPRARIERAWAGSGEIADPNPQFEQAGPAAASRIAAPMQRAPSDELPAAASPAAHPDRAVAALPRELPARELPELPALRELRASLPGPGPRSAVAAASVASLSADGTRQVSAGREEIAAIPRDTQGDSAPAPLLPSRVHDPRGPAHPAARRDSGAQLRASSDASAAAVPDVHIHIGRVELTALTAPAEPRRKPARTAAATMSLDDYLRGRSGRTQ